LKPLRRTVPLIKPQEDDKLIPDGNIKNSIENDADVRGEDDIQQEDLAINAKQSKKRKRKEREEEAKTDDLESRYITKVYSQILKKQKADPVNRQPEQPSLPVVEPEDDADNDETIDPELLQHETVNSNSTSADQTIFISNLPVKVLTSKPHLRSLKQLFATYGPITSIRFRSIAFTDLVPRKQAFITKKLHPERDTLNAYLVYQTKDSVTPAVNALNGHLWEEKHLRVDSVSNPTVPSI
jgi:nucleolar protein 12